MSEKKLSELVKAARGDRTKRKYAEDSGVNVAIISRIENGDYSPGKNVLERLTSAKAKPQGGITYKDLLEAANDNKQYKKGVVAGMAAFPMGAILNPFMIPAIVGGGVIKALDSSLETNGKNKKNEKEFLNEIKDFATGMERYKATATGAIIAKLAEQGIWCRVGKQNDTDFLLNYTDLVLMFSENEIDTWILSCFTLNEENRNRKDFIKSFAARFIDKLVHTESNPRKKASFIVDDEELYKFLLELKDKNSYRGNLSIIQFDAKNVKIIKEEYISYYDLNEKNNKMMIVKEEKKHE